jgi:hypothetical protein
MCAHYPLRLLSEQAHIDRDANSRIHTAKTLEFFLVGVGTPTFANRHLEAGHFFLILPLAEEACVLGFVTFSQ